MRTPALLLALLAGCAAVPELPEAFITLRPAAQPATNPADAPRVFRDFLILSPDLYEPRAVRGWRDEARRAGLGDAFIFVSHGDGWRGRWDCYPFQGHDEIHFPVRWAAKFLRAVLPADRAVILVVCNPRGLALSDQPLPGILYAESGIVWIIPGADWRLQWGVVPMRAVGSLDGFIQTD